MNTAILSLNANMKTITLKASPLLALLAALSSPAWAERLEPAHSVVKDAEDLLVSVNFTQPKTGDLYIAADVNGVLYFYGERGWSTTPQPREYGQTYSGVKQLNLGNSSGTGANSYPLYEVVTTPNAPDVYDTRNWIGGLASLGRTVFQVKLPAQISGDFNGDGWADDDANHTGFHVDDLNFDGLHDDDTNRDGYHADDINRDGYHDNDANHDGWADDDGNHDGFHDDDGNRDGFHDDDGNRDGYHDDDGNRDGYHDDDSNHDGYHDKDSNHDGFDD